MGSVAGFLLLSVMARASVPMSPPMVAPTEQTPLDHFLVRAFSRPTSSAVPPHGQAPRIDLWVNRYAFERAHAKQLAHRYRRRVSWTSGLRVGHYTPISQHFPTRTYAQLHGASWVGGVWRSYFAEDRVVDLQHPRPEVDPFQAALVPRVSLPFWRPIAVGHR